MMDLCGHGGKMVVSLYTKSNERTDFPVNNSNIRVRCVQFETERAGISISRPLVWVWVEKGNL